MNMMISYQELVRTFHNITVRLKGLLRADLQQHKLNPAKFVA
ncbi:Uncharacterised protein [Escherichia coli]|nr:Uncharacterised protein [Escherichia coli]